MRLNRIILSIIMSFIATAAAAAANISVRPANPDGEVQTFGRAEWIVDAGRSYGNPFDPEEIAIDATFAGPNGEKIVLPAFWYKAPGGDPADAHWRVRFCPTAAGEWSLTVSARDEQGASVSEPVKFTVGPSKHGGFVRRVPDNPRYFQLDSGEPYFPVGVNLAWPANLSYAEWFQKLSDVGINYARVWIYRPMIETVEAGLGRLDLEALAHYDAALESADRHGIRVMLTFNNYRNLVMQDSWGAAGWATSPYNAANGGPIAEGIEFFTNPTTRQLYKAKLRYLVGRYSAFTNIALWELWNEQDHLPKPGVPLEWMQEMTAYLRDIDPYDHLITTSYSWDDRAEVWRIPQIDLTQRHFYSDGSLIDFVSPVVASARSYEQYGKPHLISEIGISWKGPDIHFDPEGTGITLHNTLWAGVMSGSVGTANYWWWDNYIEPKKLWNTFRGVSKFAATVDWPRRKFAPVEASAPELSQSGPETFSDMVVLASGGWGRSHGRPIVIDPSGRTSRPMSNYLYGPDKESLRTATTLEINVARPTEMVILVHEVSRRANLQVSINGMLAQEFTFDATPGSPGVKSSRTHPSDPELYQGVFDSECTVQLQPGKQVIRLENSDGDWVKVRSITFRNLKSSRYADLGVVGLQDENTGETILWLHDPGSNWKADQEKLAPGEYDQVRFNVRIPDALSGGFTALWWDTRKGEIVREERLKASEGQVQLVTPRFSRDIALRLVPAAGH